jgi:hypothetical protein
VACDWLRSACLRGGAIGVPLALSSPDSGRSVVMKTFMRGTSK